MGKNKHSGGGPGPSKMLKRIKGIFKRKEDEDLNDMRGDSDEDNDEHDTAATGLVLRRGIRCGLIGGHISKPPERG